MVYSGNETLLFHGQAMCASLQLDREVHLVLDAPWGYALLSLPGLPKPIVVVTGVSSVPYLQDLLDLRPQGVLAHPVGPQEVLAALVRASKGEHFYEGPSLESPIQTCERAVLRRLAFGLTNLEIAEELKISERTVKNRVSALLEKLPVRNRVELALYYLGMHPKIWAGEKVTP